MLNIHQELDRLLRRTEAAEIRREEFRGSEAMRLAESDDSYPRVVGALPPSSHSLDASRNPTKPGTFSRLKTDRPRRQVAGPAVDVRLTTIGADDAIKQ